MSNKDCVAPGASPGVTRSAMEAAVGVAYWGNHSWVTLASLRSGSRGGRGVRPYTIGDINCSDSHHMNETGSKICS